MKPLIYDHIPLLTNIQSTKVLRAMPRMPQRECSRQRGAALCSLLGGGRVGGSPASATPTTSSSVNTRMLGGPLIYLSIFYLHIYLSICLSIYLSISAPVSTLSCWADHWITGHQLLATLRYCHNPLLSSTSTNYRKYVSSCDGIKSKQRKSTYVCMRSPII